MKLIHLPFCLGLVASLLLTACSQGSMPDEPETVVASMPGAIVYECTGGATPERMEVLYEIAHDRVTVLFNDDTYTLPQTPSGSGTRYSNGSVTWWSKGNEALWQMDENLLLRDCQRAN